MTCCIENDLGAYVLNALEPDEARTLQAHLADCPTCCDEVGSLAGTASLLALLTLADVERLYGPEPGVDGAPPVRPRRRAAVAMIAAAVIAATALGALQATTGEAGPSSTRTVQVIDPATHVRAAVTFTDRGWGTQLHLSMTGAYPSGRCSLVARSGDGQSDTAATWAADAQGSASVDGATVIPTSKLTELDVVTPGGVQLVRINLPGNTP